MWTSSTTSDSPGKSSKMRLSSSITDAGSRPASTRRCSGRGARAAASAAAWSRGALDLGVGRVERRDVGDLDADLAVLPVVDGAADEHDLVGLQRRLAASAITFSNTSSSTWPSRSSSVANITVEPDAGADLLRRRDHAADLDPLAVAALGHLGAERVGLHAQRLAHALERVLGDEEADRLLLDREQLGAGRTPRSGSAGASGRRTARRRRPLAAEAAEVEDRALADLRVELRLLARRPAPDSSTVEHAPARGAGRAERAALDQRLDRLLVDGAAVDALAEVPQRRERPSPRARP